MSPAKQLKSAFFRVPILFGFHKKMARSTLKFLSLEDLINLKKKSGHERTEQDVRGALTLNSKKMEISVPSVVPWDDK